MEESQPLGIRVISAENHDRGPSWVSRRIFVNSVVRK